MNLYDPNFVRQYFNNLSKDYDSAEKISFRLLQHWRNQILKQAQFSIGATVYDLGCGGGNNFAALTRKIGRTGKIIGVDYSNKMIEKAQFHVLENHWQHIELMECDFVESSVLESNSDNIFGTFCLKTLPIEQYDALANQAWKALKPYGQCVLGEFSLPKSPFYAFLTQKYLKHIVPFFGRVMGASPKAHELLSQYVQQFDGCIALEKAFQLRGFKTKRFILSHGWITGIVAEKVLPVSEKPLETIDFQSFMS
jgi:demethylmenaquinone methyltransferase/2-methoxy-6-polyprenyl-1,4-benzoquinol methylase